MKRFRTVLFWIHLAIGVTAGLIVLVMSATGALLAFKPQILNFVERDVRMIAAPSPGQPRIGVQAMLAHVRERRPDAEPTMVTLESDLSRSATIALGRDGVVYVDPYSGRVLGEGSKSTQAFFRGAENWHRWLAVSGDGRATVRSLTDAANLGFLLLAVSGLYLWWPRRWVPQHVKPILRFKPAATGRARDFNWHNTIGFWCAPVLIVLTATGVVMSYSWANNLLYRIAGSPPPAERGAAGPGGGPQAGPAGRRQGERPAGGPRGERAGREEERRSEAKPVDFDQLWSRAEQQVPTWRVITLRMPMRPRAPVAFTISDTRNWNAFARSQLLLEAESGAVVRWEPYEGNSLGQKMRGWARFAHTGELGGWACQALAGAACVGGVFLVCTGLSLAVRRLFGWRLWERVGSPRNVPRTARGVVADGAVSAPLAVRRDAGMYGDLPTR